MPRDNAAVVRRWFEVVWNEGREDLMEELAVPDVILHGVGGPNQIMQGIEAFTQVVLAWRGAVPDVRREWGSPR